ncbi:hypothetical protein [Streptomyces sp. NPDC093260]|uniref:hypothetical protein n=1 Tax=Streptomyces sp. NPDC093260 TaxID=3155073 RepID=UPI00342393E8
MSPTEQHPRQIHLAAQLPGVHNVTVWSGPRSTSQISVDNFAHLARTAERGRFDFLFLAEGRACASTRARSMSWTWRAARTT